MSIRQNKEEAIRWLRSPDGTKVWVKCPIFDCGWELTDDPDWVSGCVYVVDDRHAEIRKEWIDMGKPPVEYNSCTNGWYETPEPTWSVNMEYRIKKSEWVTPEGEDPIKYHAKRLNPDRETKFVKDRKNFCVVYLPDDNKYEIRESTTFYVLTAVYMDYKEAVKIVFALNNGELKPKNRE